MHANVIIECCYELVLPTGGESCTVPHYATCASFHVHHTNVLDPEAMRKHDKVTIVWRIRAPYPLPLQLNSEGHVHKINMRLVQLPAGAIGVAAVCHKMVKWALRFVLSGKVSQSGRSSRNIEQDCHRIHHEEADCRIKANHADS